MKGNRNTKISLSLVFYTLFSDTIESSDVVVNEDLEYMVQDCGWSHFGLD